MNSPPMLCVTISHLKMPASEVAEAPPLPAGAAVVRDDHPTQDRYLGLYRDVGEPWRWWERLLWTDAQWQEILTDPRRGFLLLEWEGECAGYAELDFSHPHRADLAYFGLRPAYIGQGLGMPFLRNALAVLAQHHHIELTLQTCTLDHPRALDVYRKAGFRVDSRQDVQVPDPCVRGLIPEDRVWQPG